MDLPVVNHEDYFAKIGDDHKFPINKFGELANYLIKNNIMNDLYIFKTNNNLGKNGKNNNTIGYLKKSFFSKKVTIDLNGDKLFKKKFK